MLRTFLLFVLLLAAALIPVAAVTLATRPACPLDAAIIGGPNWLGQYRLEVRQPLGCPQSWARIRTRHGAVLPPIGYFKLGGGFPPSRSYLVFKGAHVERRLAPNVWGPLALRGAPW